VKVGGTSASAPTFAGIVALLNDARLKEKKSPLGFLNPLLYSKGMPGFNDITSGNNTGCGTSGFNVSDGLDFGLVVDTIDHSLLGDEGMGSRLVNYPSYSCRT
jgi:tripeptidyl-peptidase-1